MGRPIKINQKEVKIYLSIIEHGADKQFPKGAILTLEYGDRIYQELLDLDLEYKNGDTGLEPKHLTRLFRGMARLLQNDSYQIKIPKQTRERVEDLIYDKGYFPSSHGVVILTISRAELRDKLLNLISTITKEAVRQRNEQEISFLEDLKLGFDVWVCECGEPWEDTDGADMVKDRLKKLSTWLK